MMAGAGWLLMAALTCRMDFRGEANRIHCDKSEEREVQGDFRFSVRATRRMDFVAPRGTVVEQIL